MNWEPAPLEASRNHIVSAQGDIICQGCWQPFSTSYLIPADEPGGGWYDMCVFCAAKQDTP